MSKELLLVVDAVANEKGVPREVIFDAIEAALASAAKRYPEEEVLTRVVIDHKDGSYETFRRWEVVADDVVMESPDRQIRLMDAVDEAEGVEVGDYIEEQIENPDFYASLPRPPSRSSSSACAKPSASRSWMHGRIAWVS